MADDGVYTKNADIQARAGIDANTTAKATAATDIYVLDIEATINAKTGTDWSTQFATAAANFKTALTEAGACRCAINVIGQDPDAIGRGAAAFMVNMLDDRANAAEKILKDKDGRDIVLGVKT